MKRACDDLYFSFSYLCENSAESEECGMFNGTAKLKCTGKSAGDVEDAVDTVIMNLPKRLCKRNYSANISFASKEDVKTVDDKFYTLNAELKIKEWRCL